MAPVRVRRPGSLTVASLNAHWGRGADGALYDPVAACRALDADVVALQEVTAPPGVDLARSWIDRVDLHSHAVVLSEAFDHHRGSWAQSAPPAAGRWGLVVLSTLPLLDVRVVALGQAKRDPPRVAQVVELDVDGRRLRLVNTHLTHRLPDVAAQLARFARVVRSSHTASTVAVGDLNVVVGALPGVLTGLRRAVRAATWPAARPWVQLDHVLIGSDIACQSSSVIKVGSDHCAVRTELHWRP